MLQCPACPKGMSAGRRFDRGLRALAGVDREAGMAERNSCWQRCQRGVRTCPPLEGLRIGRCVGESHGSVISLPFPRHGMHDSLS